MANHINIQHPDNRGLYSSDYQARLEIGKLKVELEQLTGWYKAVSADLESVFNRIEAGDQCELHYGDGRVFIITGKLRD